MKTFLSFHFRPYTFAALLMAILCTSLTHAQDTHRKVVLLKTSEKLTGEIIEAVPEQYIRIKLEDGTIKRIEADDISSIRDEEKLRHHKRRLENANKIVGPSVIGSMFAGYDLVSGLSYLVLEPSVSAGIRIKRQHIGLGVGLIYASTQDPNNAAFGPYTSYSTNTISMPTLSYLPLFLNYHGDFGRRKVFFSADVSVGYPISLNKKIGYDEYFDQYGDDHKEVVSQSGSFYAELSPGISFKITPELLLNVSLTFHLLMIKESNNDNQYIPGISEPSYVTSLGSDQRTIGAVGGALKIIF